MSPATAGTLRWLRGTVLRVVPVAIGVVVVTFFLLRLVPGDPAQAILGDQATDAAVAALREQLGLNAPLGQQFLDFVLRLLTTGDTGASLIYGESSMGLVLGRAGISLSLVLVAAVFVALIVVPLAVAAATNKDRLIDHVVRVFPAVGLSMPVFWVGLLLVLLFAVRLQWLPVGGAGSGFWGGLRSLILPGLAVAISIAPPLIRSLRAELLEVLGRDFVTTVRAAGLPRHRILFVHVLRNALVPTLTLFGLNLAYLIGGTLVVERVFAINGLGALMFEAIGNRDFPVVQAIALFCAIAVVLVTILTDFLVHRIDPRARLA